MILVHRVVVQWIGCGREINEEHVEDYVEEVFQLSKAKLDKEGDGPVNV